MFRRLAASFLVGALLLLGALPAAARDGDVYAGDLTLTIAQPVVIEAGGTLNIGPMSIGSSDPKPVLCGALGETPLITVEPGGELVLNDVVLDTTGQGLLFVQQPGALVRVYNTELGDDLVSWSPPLIVNQPVADYDTLWLPEGTPLTGDLLPAERKVEMQYQGREETVTLAVTWDLTGYDGRTTGEWSVPGQFVDETGAALPSAQPLEWPVRWYEPQQIVVTLTRFSGGTAAAASLVALLPEEADTWGEISADGRTWSAWEDFTLEPQPDGTTLCLFAMPDNTPRYYRLVAQDWFTETRWLSEAFLLPVGTTGDQGGNRGGSTAPVTPDRTPEPVPEPIPEPTATPQPAPAAPAAASQPHGMVPQPTPAAPTPEPTATPRPAVPATAETADATAAPGPTPAPEVPEVPAASGWLWALGGLALCGAAGGLTALLLRRR